MQKFFRLLTMVHALAALLVSAAQPAAAQQFDTRARQAFMLDAGTGTILYAKDADSPFPPASLAKLMTMEVVFNALREGRVSPGDTFFVSEHAWRTGGAPSRTATMFAEVKSSVELENLIKGAIVHTANDACIVIAEGLAGSEENFAALMNQRAREIGLEQSVFVNPTGLPAEGQAVTAREMVRLAQHLQQEYPNFYSYFALPEFTWNKIRQLNRNPLLQMGNGVDGLATGHDKETGYSLVAAAAREGRRIFLALGGLESESQRLAEARRMLDWGLRSFESRELFAEGASIGEASVFGGAKSSVELKAEGAVSLLVPLASRDALRARIVYQGPVEAPVIAGTRIGALKIWVGETLTLETPVYAAEDIATGPLHRRALDAVEELLIGWIRQL